MHQEVCQRLTLPDPVELDGVTLDGRSDEVIAPPSPGRSRSSQRQGHSAGAYAIDILEPRGCRRRDGTHNGTGITREGFEQVLPHSTDLSLGEWPDDQGVQPARQRLGGGGKGILPSRPGDDSRPRETPLTIQLTVQTD